MDPGDYWKPKAREFLSEFINKILRVWTTDGRMFRGALKCVDHERNIVLVGSSEHRQLSTDLQDQPILLVPKQADMLDMSKSRSLGLIVVPGAHIVKIELEIYASRWQEVAEDNVPASTNTKATE